MKFDWMLVATYLFEREGKADLDTGFTQRVRGLVFNSFAVHIQRHLCSSM